MECALFLTVSTFSDETVLVVAMAVVEIFWSQGQFLCPCIFLRQDLGSVESEDGKRKLSWPSCHLLQSDNDVIRRECDCFAICLSVYSRS